MWTNRVRFDVDVGDGRPGEAGSFWVEVRPDWAPLAAARFKELVEVGFFNDARFYRTIPGYIAQFGVAADPALNKEWCVGYRTCKLLPDEKAKVSNRKGTLSFASGGPGTRQTQMFVNLADNGGLPNFLDAFGFAPFAAVVEGMDVVQKLYGGYGLAETATGGLLSGPSQSKAAAYGNEYLTTAYPKLAFVKRATIVP